MNFEFPGILGSWNLSLLPGNEPPPPPPPDDTKFSQADLNKILADEKRKHQEKNGQLIKELEELKKTKGLSEQQKSDLESRIEQLTNEHLTKEEQAKRESERLKKDYEGKHKEVETDRDSWRNRYTEMLIENSITSQAREAKAVSDEQILAMLRHKASIAEELIDGKPSGKFVVKIKHHDEESKKTLEYTPDEMMKIMLDNPKKYGNLFQSTLTGGVGGTGTHTFKGDPGKLDPAAYRAHRKDQAKK